MISDLEFDSYDTEVDLLFREAKREESAAAPRVPDEERVERIIEQAKHEVVIKDTAEFIFRSFGPVIVELLTAVLGAILPAESQSESETARPDRAGPSPSGDRPG